MKRILLTTIGILCLVAGVFSQNVFDPNDPIVNYNASAPPATPAMNVITKWVRTPRMGWNTSKFKSYFYNDMAFRLRFPNGYNPNDKTKKYPVIIFFHGGGEIAQVYDNEFHLLWGAQMFEQMMNDGKFNAFMIFPQQKTIGWEETYFSRMNDILDTLEKYNNADPDRIIPMGLSIGGNGVLSYSNLYPKRTASAIASSPSWIQLFVDSRANFIHIPTWIGSGGKDNNPDPMNVRKFVDSFAASGGDVRWTLSPNLGHVSWNEQWREPYLIDCWNNAHKANPLIFFQKNQFCPDTIINVKIGITPGFYAYEWQKDNSTIATTVNSINTITDGSSLVSYNANEITVNGFGSYRVRFKRTATSEWSLFSPKPAVISAKPYTTTPAIIITGLKSKVLPAPDGSTTVPLELPAGYSAYEWKDLATGIIVSSTRSFDAPIGQYQAIVKEQNICNSIPSPVFAVVNANGEPKPKAVVDLAAVRKSSTSMELTWSPDANPAAYEIYRSLTTGGPYTLIAITGIGAKVFTDQGLTVNAGYFYVVRPVNDNGAAILSNEAVATAVDVTAPSAPGNLKAVSTGTNFIELDWDNATDNVGVTGYDVYVNNIKTYTTTGSTIMADNLTDNTTYNFTVKALDAAGNSSGFSNAVSAKTLAIPDTVSPSVPANLLAGNISTTSIALDWNNSTDNIGVTGYEVFVNGVKTYTTSVSNADAINLEANTTYIFSVLALDAAGNRSALSAELTVKTLAATPPADLTAPSAPLNLKAISIGTTSIELDWDNSTDNVGVTGYDVYVNGVKTYSSSGSTIIANNLASNTSYSFTVKAFDAAGNVSAFSTAVIAKTLMVTPPADITAPSVPVNLKVLASTTSTVQLDWDNSTDNVGVTGYDVYVNGVKKQTTVSSTAIATGLLPNTTYTFTVKAIDLAGNISAFSNAVTGKTLDVTPPADVTAPTAPANLKVISITTTTVQLDWNNATDNVGVTGYDVYVNGVKKYSAVTSTIIADNLLANTVYNFTVKAIDAAGNNSAFSNEVSAKTLMTGDLTAPSTPGNLKVIYTTRNSVELDWDNATDNVGVTRYDIYVNGVKKYTSTTSAFTATSLTAYANYKFYVKAADLAGNISGSSNQVKGIPMLIGLKYRYYEGAWTSLPNFNDLTPVKQGVTEKIYLDDRRQGVNDNYGFVWEGYIKINKPGLYTFETRSDDGSRFYFNTHYQAGLTPQVNNDGLHEEKSVTSTIYISRAGVYPFAVTFFERTGEGKMNLYWKGPGFSRQAVPMSAFSDIIKSNTSYLDEVLAYFNGGSNSQMNMRFSDDDGDNDDDKGDNDDKGKDKDKNKDRNNKNKHNGIEMGNELSTVAEDSKEMMEAATGVQISKAFPSPFIDLVNIEFTNIKSDSKVSVDIFDMYGKLVHNQQFGSVPAGKSKLTVNINNKQLSAGFYMIRLNIDGKSSTPIKLVKAAK